MPQSLETLIDGTDAVVRGTVTSIASSQDYPDNEIYTVVTLSAAQHITTSGFEPLDGDFQFRHWGGTVLLDDGSEETWSIGGIPEFSLNDEVILFVSENGKRELPIYGGPQGMYRVAATGSVLNSEFTPLFKLETSVPVIQLSKGNSQKSEISSTSNAAKEDPTGLYSTSSEAEKPELVSFENAIPNDADLLAVDIIGPDTRVSIDEFSLSLASMVSTRAKSLHAKSELLEKLTIPQGKTSAIPSSVLNAD